MLASFRVGNGPDTIVLVHGFLGSGRNLASLARRWAAADPSKSFLVPDLTGHGASPALPSGADLSTLARDILELARAEGLSEPISITGHSLGGRVALVASLIEPEAVKEITLLDIAPGPIPVSTSESASVLDTLLAARDVLPDRETARNLLLEKGLSPGIADWALMNLIHGDAGYLWRIDRRALAALHERTNGADLWEAVEHPRATIKCIRGGRARYVSDADKRRMEAAGCPVATIAGAGHFLHVDAPDELLALLTGQASWV